jgi:Uma2 family endonuclease
MNRPEYPVTTMAAEGLPRRRFTVAEIDRMTELGIFEEDERIELIGGEIVPMVAKGDRHEILKTVLNLYWAARLPPQLLFTTETTFRLSVDTFLEPDFVFYPKAVGIRGLKGETAKLVVELSDSSLAYDLGRKARLYAGFGVAELWVIDAVRRTTRIHREPHAEGYGDVVGLGSDEALVPKDLPGLAVTLAELDLD